MAGMAAALDTTVGGTISDKRLTEKHCARLRPHPADEAGPQLAECNQTKTKLGTGVGQFGWEDDQAVLPAVSFSSTSTNSPSMLIWTSLLTMNLPSSIMSNRMPKSLRLI